MQTAPRLPNRMSPLQMQEITRACNVGADPKELAADYGITIHAVLAIARRCNVQRQTARAVARTRQIVRKAPSITTPEPIERHGSTYVVERYDAFAPAGHGKVQRITLPLLTIQTRAA